MNYLKEIEMQLETLYSRRSDGKLQEWTIHVYENKFWTVSGIHGGALVVTKPTVCKGKNVGRSNETTSEEQALSEAKAIWNKKYDSGYRPTKDVKINSSGFFEPMLAKSYDDYKDGLVFPVACQPKMDGGRCVARATGLWTRNGKVWVSCPHIEAALEPLFAKNNNLILDGELYCDKYKNDFDTMMSLIKRSKPTKEDFARAEANVQLWLYDIYIKDVNFIERQKRLVELVSKLDSKYLVLVNTIVAKNHTDIDKHYEQCLNDGFEGQIIRADAPYENKRTSSLLKRKEFITEEYSILDIQEGLGNRKDTAGFMCFVTKEGKSFKSNIKGSHEYLAKIWRNRKNIIGKNATIRFPNLTPDGVPRFPFVVDLDRESYE